jgi:RimJ/RimL family protein N-acetyltransferase
MKMSVEIMADKHMNQNIFQGECIRLVEETPEKFAVASSRWGRDSEYQRLLDTEHAQLWSTKTIQKWHEDDLDKEQPNDFFFHIRTLDTDQLIGFIGLVGLKWNHGEAWVGIGIGDRNSWGKGYGTDALLVLLRYAFTELNIHRVSLGVFAYNRRAIRSYEKAGFQLEGVERELLHRDGSRSDGLYMGILREEWEHDLS